jgi:hypothetical protein
VTIEELDLSEIGNDELDDKVSVGRLSVVVELIDEYVTYNGMLYMIGTELLLCGELSLVVVPVCTCSDELLDNEMSLDNFRVDEPMIERLVEESLPVVNVLTEVTRVVCEKVGIVKLVKGVEEASLDAGSVVVAGTSPDDDECKVIVEVTKIVELTRVVEASRDDCETTPVVELLVLQGGLTAVEG